MSGSGTVAGGVISLPTVACHQEKSMEHYDSTKEARQQLGINVGVYV